MRKALVPYFLFLLACIFFLSQGCVSSGSRLRQTQRSVISRAVPSNYDYRRDYRINRKRLMAAIRQWLGTPYCLGGNTKKCIDCSGFVKNVYMQVCGAKLPRISKKQYKLGRRINKGNLSIGDLVFFRTGRAGITHVGIYIGNNKFAHASVTKGVTITSINAPYFKKRYAGARRLF